MSSPTQRDAARDPRLESSDDESVVDQQLEEARRNAANQRFLDLQKRSQEKATPPAPTPAKAEQQQQGASCSTFTGGTEGPSTASTSIPGTSCSSAPTRADFRCLDAERSATRAALPNTIAAQEADPGTSSGTRSQSRATTT